MTETTKTDALGRTFVVETKAHKRAARRTGRPMELRTKYRRRLQATMRAHLPQEAVADTIEGPLREDKWTTIPMRPEVVALLRLLARHHTAHAGKSEVSATEVLHALVDAGLPVLLRREGWQVPGAGA